MTIDDLRRLVKARLAKLTGNSAFNFTSTSSADEYLQAGSGTLFYDYHPIPEGLPSMQLAGILDYLPDLDIKEGPWLAGGAARRLYQGLSLEGGDIDLFFNKPAKWLAAKSLLCGYQIIFESKRAITYHVHGFKVQIINRAYYDTLDEVFKDFDFSVCQIATDGKVLAYTAQAAKDLDDSVLRFAPQGKVARHTLLGRMLKYINHGFMPEPGFYELAIKAGLDHTSPYDIFEGSISNADAIYDHDEQVDNLLSVRDLQDSIMRDTAARLGVSVPND